MHMHLKAIHYIACVAVESPGGFGPEACMIFLSGPSVSPEGCTSEPLSYHYLMQQISVEMQRGIYHSCHFGIGHWPDI